MLRREGTKRKETKADSKKINFFAASLVFFFILLCITKGSRSGGSLSPLIEDKGPLSVFVRSGRQGNPREEDRKGTFFKSQSEEGAASLTDL